MKKPTVKELEKILNSKEELVVYKLPNGEIGTRQKRKRYPKAEKEKT